MLLDHALTLNAKEVKQALQVSQYPMLTPEGKKEVERTYDKILNGEEVVSDARIKSDRKNLRQLLTRAK